jgi:hypothetical protein
MNCAACGSALLEDARFCSTCGTPVRAPSGEETPTTVVREEHAEGVCPSCGATLLPEARFCNNCGGAVGSSPPAPPPAEPPPTVSWQAIPPAGRSLAGQAAQPVPDWGQELARLWSRVGSGQLLTAAILAVLALVFGVLGLQMALAGEGFSSGEFHGTIWLGLSSVLILAAVGWAAVAREHLKGTSLWSPGTDLAVAAATAGLALIFGFVTLGVSLSWDQGFESTFSTMNIGAWATFAQLWAFASLAWLALSRPLDRRTSQVMAAIGGGLALLFSLIGLSMGLGDDLEDFVHGAGWLTFASICATLATGSLFGYVRTE